MMLNCTPEHNGPAILKKSASESFSEVYLVSHVLFCVLFPCSLTSLQLRKRVESSASIIGWKSLLASLNV